MSRLDENKPQPTARKHFRFFDLPSEIRLCIYEMVLLIPGRTLDLDPSNYISILPRLRCLLVSRQMHDEAYRVFYGSYPVRLFPIHGRFFNTKKPLLMRMGPRYRAAMTTLDLRLGPGWGAPPRCQHTDKSLGLAECVSVRVLKIFVEIDPSGAIFHGFRGKGKDEHSYKLFCVDILRGVIAQVPSLEVVEIDAYPSVNRDSPLVVALVREVERAGKKLVWSGDEQSGLWSDSGLEAKMAGMRL